MIAASAQSAQSAQSSTEKATPVSTNLGTRDADTTTATAEGEDLIGIAQALTSLSRKVSGTDASTSSDLAEGPNSTENDPDDDQAYGRFPDTLRLMMDYATAEGCMKPSRQRAASWSDDGKSIVILDKTLFCEHVLPQFFKRTKFPSFVRKLFRWGFSRVTSKAIRRSKQQIFTHPKFVRVLPNNANSSAATSIASTSSAAAMANTFIQSQTRAAVPTSVSPLQVNAVSQRATPPASQVPPLALALSSNGGIQVNPQEEVVAQLLARRQQLEIEWESLQEEAKLKGVSVGNAHQPLPSAVPIGMAFPPSAATIANSFSQALGAGVGGGPTVLASSSMQLQAYYMALNDISGTFRRVSLEPAPPPSPASATPQALPGQSFFNPQAVRAAIAARAAASASAVPRPPQTATAAMIAGGHLPAPTLPGRPESERGIFNAAVQALHNSS